MFKKPILFFIFFFPAVVFAQVIYEKGFFIDGNGNKVECLVKNVDWNDNPDRFEYKLTPDGEPKIMETSSIQGFGIDHLFKYVRKQVKMDWSSDKLDSLSNDRNPIWTTAQLLLKVLVEGKATLLLYQHGNLIRFFYYIDDATVQQLVYKKFLKGNDVAVNSDFRQQLWSNVNCAQASQNSLSNISYSERELVRYFRKYNECKGQKPVDYSSKTKGDYFHFTIKAGLDYASFGIVEKIPLLYVTEVRNQQFDNKLNFRIGLEAEFVFPNSKKKWSVIVEPTNQYYDTKKDNTVFGGTSSIHYHSIETPIGARYYFPWGQKSRMFVNGFFVADIPIGSQIEWRNGSPLEAKVNFGFAFGAGVSHDRFSAELRYYSNRNVLTATSQSSPYYWYSNYQKLSFVLGCRLN